MFQRPRRHHVEPFIIAALLLVLSHQGNFVPSALLPSLYHSPTSILVIP